MQYTPRDEQENVNGHDNSLQASGASVSRLLHGARATDIRGIPLLRPRPPFNQNHEDGNFLSVPLTPGKIASMRLASVRGILR